MEIEAITKYKYNGAEYKNLDAIKTEVENKPGSFIDCACKNMNIPHKDKLAMFEYIVANKAELNRLLSVTIDLADNDLYSDYKNILDY